MYVLYYNDNTILTDKPKEALLLFMWNLSKIHSVYPKKLVNILSFSETSDDDMSDVWVFSYSQNVIGLI